MFGTTVNKEKQHQSANYYYLNIHNYFCLLPTRCCYMD